MMPSDQLVILVPQRIHCYSLGRSLPCLVLYSHIIFISLLKEPFLKMLILLLAVEVCLHQVSRSYLTIKVKVLLIPRLACFHPEAPMYKDRNATF